MFKKLVETLFLTKSTTLAESRRIHYKYTLSVIVLLHLTGIIVVGVLTRRWYGAQNWRDYLAHMADYLNYVVFASGLFLFLLSLKSEVLVSQTYEFASLTAQASSHQFKDFKDHLEWVNEFITPSKFKNQRPSLIVTVSTPIYGIGVGVEEATLYLSYLESWVVCYETMRSMPLPNETPKVELAIWDKDQNVSTFTVNYTKEENEKKYDLIRRYSDLMTRLYKLHSKEYIDLKLFFTDKSDARIFMACSSNPRQYAGLFAMFTPLSVQSVTKTGWTLTGYSFWEEKAYENNANFNFKLTHRDPEKNRVNQVDCIQNCNQWLTEHYGLQPQSTSSNKS